MKERVVKIGQPVPLVGVVSEPACFDPGRLAVIVLNSGVMHHVGTCRLSVRIARAAAARGLLALRFDYSGIGDSEPRTGAESFDVVSLRECGEVMDHLERTRGIRQFILYGLCSGADAAYNTAIADPRVVAISQIDAYCYRTPRFYFEHYRGRVLQLEKWKNFVLRKWRALRAPAGANAATDADGEFMELPTYTRVFPPRESVAKGLAALAARGVGIQVSFTGSEPHYNHESQFAASFRDVDFRGLLDVRYFREANHIVTQPRYQREVVEHIVAWMVRIAAARRPAQATRLESLT